MVHGGLLIIYGNNITIDSAASVESKGSKGGDSTIDGGSSGGGSINVFYRNSFNCTNITTVFDCSGGSCGNGGAGGTGSIAIGSVANGVYEDLYHNWADTNE